MNIRYMNKSIMYNFRLDESLRMEGQSFACNPKKEVCYNLL